MCSRRSRTGGGIAPTEKPMNWLELADPKDSKGRRRSRESTAQGGADRRRARALLHSRVGPAHQPGDA
ncbi:hypothetical protein P4133_27815 [Pseudomonas aeruginosa]|nr:hypothetical protein [Pseudomonas aeruginosa]